MVLYPVSAGSGTPRDDPPISAWFAVERKQKQTAREWWLVTQPDHAALAGDLAARLDFFAIPALSQEVIRAISAHDAGWAQFDHIDRVVSATPAGSRPLSFLDIVPADFLVAWTGSINAAARIGSVGAIIVSEHFCRLGQSRLASRNDTPEDRQRLQRFLAEEGCRQRRLRNQVLSSQHELEALTDVLQFCDLVSLYLCCGADQPAEFPQKFDRTTVRVRSEGDAFLFTPPVFGAGAALGVSARRFSQTNQLTTLPFLLA